MAKTTKLSQRGIGELERSIERYETYNDGFILPDTIIVIRLDAHRFGDWTALSDEYPTGPTTTKGLLLTARALMSASFRVALAYAHGDEISLVLDPTENINPLRRSKLISAFSSAAAIHFLQATGFAAMFDAKVSELPSTERLAEYLFWQRKYCYRNATTIALRRALIRRGLSLDDTETKIRGATEEQRLTQLKEIGAPIETIPPITRRGSLLYWATVLVDGKPCAKVVVDTKLADNDEAYEAFITDRISKALLTTSVNRPTQAPVTQAASERKAQVVAKQAPVQKSPQPPKQPLKPQQLKRTKKAQVSVFRMPPAQ
jgi:tRNA(His) 5'-end guanylyltransferase